MGDTLNVAIVGAGLMGSWHGRYARRCGGSVCGVVDPDRQSAERLAARYPGAHSESELESFLAKHRPQIVHVCSPLDTHSENTKAALSWGAHVLVEKPLARDSAECRELIRIADQAGLLLVPVHQFIFQRGFRRATAAISQLGRILHVDATICSAGGEHAPTQVDDIAGEILPHPLSLIERLVPGLLKSARWTMRRPAAGEWRVSTDSQGVSISILISLHARPTEASLRVAMEGGMVEVDLFHGFATIDTAPASRAAKISRPFRTSARQFGTAAANLTRRIAAREGAYPGLRTLIFEFYEAVRGRREAPIRADEILAVAAARDRIVELATEQQTRGAS